MTKKEMESAIETMSAMLRAQNGPVLAPAATVAAPVASPATVPWLATATAQAAAPAPKAAKAPAAPKVHTPLPLVGEIITIAPKDGQTWAAFKSLHIHNGKSGRAYRGAKLDARYVEYILAGGAALLAALKS